MENSVGRRSASEIKNCKYCPLFGKECAGDAVDCLCLKCPRNLGQCIRVRYCRETESILIFDEIEETDQAAMRDSIFRSWE